MANDVVAKNSPLPPALIQKIAEGLTRSYGGAGHTTRIGIPIVKLDKSGRGWSFGQELHAPGTRHPRTRQHRLLSARRGGLAREQAGS